MPVPLGLSGSPGDVLGGREGSGGYAGWVVRKQGTGTLATLGSLSLSLPESAASRWRTKLPPTSRSRAALRISEKGHPRVESGAVASNCRPFWSRASNLWPLTFRQLSTIQCCFIFALTCCLCFIFHPWSMVIGQLVICKIYVKDKKVFANVTLHKDYPSNKLFKSPPSASWQANTLDAFLGKPPSNSFFQKLLQNPDIHHHLGQIYFKLK